MRNAFVKKLEEMISKNKNIYLLTGDLGFSVFDRLKEEYPDNYINVGYLKQTWLEWPQEWPWKVRLFLFIL